MTRRPLTLNEAQRGIQPAPLTSAEWQAMAESPANIGDLGERLAWLEQRMAELAQQVERAR